MPNAASSSSGVRASISFTASSSESLVAISAISSGDVVVVVDGGSLMYGDFGCAKTTSSIRYCRLLSRTSRDCCSMQTSLAVGQPNASIGRVVNDIIFRFEKMKHETENHKNNNLQLFSGRCYVDES